MNVIARNLSVAVMMSIVAVSLGCSSRADMAPSGKSTSKLEGGNQGEFKYCYSCSAPLYVPYLKGPRENYCRNCTDDKGNLKSRQDVQNGIAQWLKTWQPGLDDRTALARAAQMMKAMPAWAG